MLAYHSVNFRFHSRLVSLWMHHCWYFLVPTNICTLCSAQFSVSFQNIVTMPLCDTMRLTGLMCAWRVMMWVCQVSLVCDKKEIFLAVDWCCISTVGRGDQYSAWTLTTVKKSNVYLRSQKDNYYNFTYNKDSSLINRLRVEFHYHHYFCPKDVHSCKYLNLPHLVWFCFSYPTDTFGSHKVRCDK